MTGEQPDTGPVGPEEGAHMFPERLKALREGENLDRKTLAELCGLSKNVVSRYENGEREPSSQSLVALADFFDVSVDYLLGREK